MRDLRQAAERLLDAVEIAISYNVDLSHVADDDKDCVHCTMAKVLRMRMEELARLLEREDSPRGYMYIPPSFGNLDA